MTDEKQVEGARLWNKGGESPGWRWQRSPQTPLNRFLGGSPIGVALRLFVVSLIVGALLMWLDIRPADVIEGVYHFFQRIWAMGFDAIRELGNYLVAGAVIVVPIWFVLRLINMRGPRS
jgi:Domain of unknown function (DUF6460)